MLDAIPMFLQSVFVPVPSDVSISFLPLAHMFERVVQVSRSFISDSHSHLWWSIVEELSNFLCHVLESFINHIDGFLLQKKNTEVMLACSCLCVSDSAVQCRGKSWVFPRWYQTSTRRHESSAAHCIPSGSTSSESCLWQGLKLHKATLPNLHGLV